MRRTLWLVAVAMITAGLALGDLGGPPPPPTPKACDIGAWRWYIGKMKEYGYAAPGFCEDVEAGDCSKVFAEQPDCTKGEREVCCYGTRSYVSASRLSAPVTLSAELAGHLVASTASSTMKPFGEYSFGAHQLTDGKLTTSWQPASQGRGGVGQWVLLSFDTEVELTALAIANGLQLTDKLGDLFEMNNRVKTGRVVLDGKRSIDFELDCSAKGMVRLALSRDGAAVKARSVRLVVSEVCRGSKWNDLALSEVVPVGAVPKLGAK